MRPHMPLHVHRGLETQGHLGAKVIVPATPGHILHRLSCWSPGPGQKMSPGRGEERWRGSEAGLQAFQFS